MIGVRSAAVVSLIALSGCASAAHSPVPSPPPSTVASISAPLGYATITVRYPANFRTAIKSGTAARRSPAFVDPISTNTLRVYVAPDCRECSTGTAVLATTVPVVNAGDGTQTLAHIPIVSTTMDVAVVEYDGSGSSLLALGETDYNAVNSGGSTSFNVQMYMNAAGIAYATAADGSNAHALSTTITNVSNGTSFYFFATDGLSGYVSAPPPNTGSGGIPGVGIVTGAINAGSTPHLAQGALGGYTASCSSGDDFVVNAAVDNPAWEFLMGNQVYGVTPATNALSQLNLLSGPVNQTPTLTLEITCGQAL